MFSGKRPTAVGVIPARMESSRLPGKMLLKETGKPLIQYAWEAASAAKSLDSVVIATDSEEIAATCEGFGAAVALTGEHPSGTDRTAEAIRLLGLDVELVVNVQGDEPELDPECIDQLVAAMARSPEIEMGTLATPIHSQAMLLDHGCVKVVRAADGRALYFSRLPIPFYRDGDTADLLTPQGEHAHMIQSPWLLHLGIYAYHPAFLLALTRMPQSQLEQLEKLEQLRALESGASILVEVVPHRSVGIDTAADYAAFVERMNSRKQ